MTATSLVTSLVSSLVSYVADSAATGEFGNNIGLDLGNGAAVAPGDLVGVEPYVNWTQWDGNGVFGPLEDDEGQVTTATVTTAGFGGTISGGSLDDGSKDYIMFERLQRVSASSAATMDVENVPYAEYDLILIFEQSTLTGSATHRFDVTINAEGKTVIRTVDAKWTGFGNQFDICDSPAGTTVADAIDGNYVRFYGLSGDVQVVIQNDTGNSTMGVCSMQIVERLTPYVDPTPAPQYGNAIGLDIGSNISVGPTDEVGVVPYVNWNPPPTGVDYTTPPLEDNEGTTTACTVTVDMAGNRNGKGSTIPGNPNSVMFERVGSIGAAGRQIDLNSVPYEMYDVYIYMGATSDSVDDTATLGAQCPQTGDFCTIRASDASSYVGYFARGFATDETVAVRGTNYALFQEVTQENLTILFNESISQAMGVAGIQIIERLEAANASFDASYDQSFAGGIEPPPDVRVTESGDTRITEGGDTRILE